MVNDFSKITVIIRFFEFGVNIPNHFLFDHLSQIQIKLIFSKFYNTFITVENDCDQMLHI